MRDFTFVLNFALACSSSTQNLAVCVGKPFANSYISSAVANNNYAEITTTTPHNLDVGSLVQIGSAGTPLGVYGIKSVSVVVSPTVFRYVKSPVADAVATNTIVDHYNLYGPVSVRTSTSGNSNAVPGGTNGVIPRLIAGDKIQLMVSSDTTINITATLVDVCFLIRNF